MVSFELRLGQKEITYFFSLLVNQYIDPPPKKKTQHHSNVIVLVGHMTTHSRRLSRQRSPSPG